MLSVLQPGQPQLQVQSQKLSPSRALCRRMALKPNSQKLGMGDYCLCRLVVSVPGEVI